jgi:hypothetical protein
VHLDPVRQDRALAARALHGPEGRFHPDEQEVGPPDLLVGEFGPIGSTAWWTWGQALRLPDPAAQRTLDEYGLAATTRRARWKALDPEVAALASREPWVAPVARLRCLRGIDTLTAVTVLLEVVDFRRFARPLARGKRPINAATAVARELYGFLWAVMVQVPA